MSFAATVFDVSRRSFTGVVCTDGEVGLPVDCPSGLVVVSAVARLGSCVGCGGLGILLLLGVCSALTLVSVGGKGDDAAAVLDRCLSWREVVRIGSGSLSVSLFVGFSLSFSRSLSFSGADC